MLYWALLLALLLWNKPRFQSEQAWEQLKYGSPFCSSLPLSFHHHCLQISLIIVLTAIGRLHPSTRSFHIAYFIQPCEISMISNPILNRKMVERKVKAYFKSHCQKGPDPEQDPNFLGRRTNESLPEKRYHMIIVWSTPHLRLQAYN